MRSPSRVVTLPGPTRTRASARLRRALCDARLTQEQAGRLVGKDARQVRRWLTGGVPLGALELLVALEERTEQVHPNSGGSEGAPAALVVSAHDVTSGTEDRADHSAVNENPREPATTRRAA
jgi:hypothetical protein